MHAPLAARLIVATSIIAAAIAPQTQSQSRFVGPAISSVVPSGPSRSASAQTLTIAGSNFSPGLSVDVMTPDGRTLGFAGPAIQARRETSFQVAVILALAGPYTLIVTNADGAASEPFTIKAQASAGKPRIHRVLPDHLRKDHESQELSVTGERFTPGLVVYVTDPIGAVHLVKGPAIGAVSATSFEVSVVLDMEGEYMLMVTSLSGESSDEVTLTVAQDARRR